MVGRSDSSAGMARPMGYQPSLDGLRALSVIGVILYHGGFDWMRGGFLGVEVFFVVSGFLITSLLLSEREESGRIDFGQFWVRRARRLLPALFAMLLAVLLWAAIFGSERQLSDLRRDVPWAVLYVGNWGQILGDVPYFGSDPLLKHVWSLAVEEQWYLFWPIAFVGLMALKQSTNRLGALVVGLAAAIMGFTFWLETGSPNLLGGPPSLFAELDRTNFMYLSTITRSSGLLLGAGAAFVWRPWRSSAAVDAPVGRFLDPIGAGALAALGCAFVTATLTSGSVYQWILPLTSTLSVVAVMIAVHPAAIGFRAMLSWAPVVQIGKRSYGLYLWSWPIFVVGDALRGSVVNFLVALAISIVVAEMSYRFVETPIRQGALGRLWANRVQRPRLMMPVGAGSALVVGLAIFYIGVDQFNQFEGGEEADFDLAAIEDVVGSDDEAAQAAETPAESLADGSPDVAADDVVDELPVEVPPETVAPTTTIPSGPSIAIVGDSQANALARNLPNGVEQVFGEIRNGSVDGCSVWDSGRIGTTVNANNNFAACSGWQEKWADSADGVDVALVVIGAWDVFDIIDGDDVYTFQTSAADQKFASNLISGLDAMIETGADVAILEVPCMRPVSAEGAGVRPLPERGDDARVAHLNGLIRWVSSQYGPEVRVFDGPDEWCNDEDIATDLGYRWDGVHVYKPGGKLIFEKIAAPLLELTRRDG